VVALGRMSAIISQRNQRLKMGRIDEKRGCGPGMPVRTCEQSSDGLPVLRRFFPVLKRLSGCLSEKTMQPGRMS